MKVLGIHGRGSDITKKSWQHRIKKFKENGLELDLYQFNPAGDPTYKSWEKTFQIIDFSKYSLAYTNSLGCATLTKYILEHNIPLDRIVMCVPGISHAIIEGKKPNLKALFESLEDINLTHLVKELYVIHAKDDEEVPYEEGQKFAKQVGAEFIGLEEGGHFLKGHLDLIINKLKD